MTEDIIPEEIKQFLLRDIDSVAQWEGLLLLRAEPDKGRNAFEVARSLYISEQEAASLLAGLVERNLLTVTGTPSGIEYRYRAATPELAALVDRAAELYRLYLIPITKIIHAKVSKVQGFADAFRLKKD